MEINKIKIRDSAKGIDMQTMELSKSRNIAHCVFGDFMVTVTIENDTVVLRNCRSSNKRMRIKPTLEEQEISLSSLF